MKTKYYVIVILLLLNALRESGLPENFRFLRWHNPSFVVVLFSFRFKSYVFRKFRSVFRQPQVIWLVPNLGTETGRIQIISECCHEQIVLTTWIRERNTVFNIELTNVLWRSLALEIVSMYLNLNTESNVHFGFFKQYLI